jgi:uncharacterized protein YndB with AHSA1/START domain/DNA-binding transcriptional ArsR family regulator
VFDETQFGETPARSDLVFKALADATRRELLDSLKVRNGQSLRELCAELDMARQSVSKHLAVLEQANLVTPVWRGREKLHFLNAAPLTEIGGRWINRYDRARVDALADLKNALEGTRMSKPEFVYTSYIRTSPKQLWQALTEPAFTRRYWNGVTLTSDWTTGATITVGWDDGTVITDPEQVVLAADPYRTLSYTWHTFTPEWARVNGISAQTQAAFAAEPRSKVTFNLDEVEGDLVKLTVVHDGFEPGSVVLSAVGGGWPQVISKLKTLLETGTP